MKNILILIYSTLFIGCASMYGTPEERMARNKALSDYTLCEKLAVAALAPEEVRTEWAMELQNRGKDCDAYAAAFAMQRMNSGAASAALLNYSGQMLTPQPMYIPQQAPTRTNCRQFGGTFSCTTW